MTGFKEEINLRKELVTILTFLSAEKDIKPFRYNHYVDKILKLIEKRINSLLDDIKKEREYAFRNDFNELLRETAYAQKYIGQVKEILKE